MEIWENVALNVEMNDPQRKYLTENYGLYLLFHLIPLTDGIGVVSSGHEREISRQIARVIGYTLRAILLIDSNVWRISRQ
jgi:hypothetical protein